MWILVVSDVVCGGFGRDARGIDWLVLSEPDGRGGINH